MIHEHEKIGIELHQRPKSVGVIKRCNRDFVVREITEDGIVGLLDETRLSGSYTAPYTIFNVTKNGVPTKHAVMEVVRQLRVPPDDITYQGMKDKWAITSQLVAIRSACLPPECGFDHRDIYLRDIGTSDKPLRLGGNIGNAFCIRVRNCHQWPDLSDIHRVPNFFGMQRFGRDCNEHHVGRLLLTGDYVAAAESISFPPLRERFEQVLDESGETHRIAFLHPSMLESTRFSILQWQSYLFNRLVSHYLRKNDKLLSLFPLWRPEHRTLYKRVWEPRSQLDADFVRLAAKSERRTLVCPSNFRLRVESDDNLVFEFELPSGSYATTVLGQLYTLVETEHGG